MLAALIVVLTNSVGVMAHDADQDKFWQEVKLGESLAGKRKYGQAISSYKKAVVTPHGWGADQMGLMFDLEKSMSQEPRNPDGHFALGQVLERWDYFDEAEGEYKQAIAVSPHLQNATVEMYLASGRMRRLKRDSESKGRQIEEIEAYKSRIAAMWHPSRHKGFLLTRCWLWIEPGVKSPDVKIVVSSGSLSHDRSAADQLRMTPIEWFGQRWGLYDFACMSEEKTSRIELHWEGHATAMPRLPNEPPNTRPIEVPSWMRPVVN